MFCIGRVVKAEEDVDRNICIMNVDAPVTCPQKRDSGSQSERIVGGDERPKASEFRERRDAE